MTKNGSGKHSFKYTRNSSGSPKFAESMTGRMILQTGVAHGAIHPSYCTSLDATQSLFFGLLSYSTQFIPLHSRIGAI